jgi:hypothetical protein
MLLGAGYLMVLCLPPVAAEAASLPLSLKLWSLRDTKTITCTGKSWVAVPAGTLQRNAVIVVVADANPSHSDSLLACDDGAGGDAPITGDTAAMRPIGAGQTVAQGTLDIIFLSVPTKQGTQSLIAFPVNTLDGEIALMSKTGKGVIRVIRAKGIEVYPPSYKISSVDESTTYRLQEPPVAPTPCVVRYFADDPNAPQKIIRSSLDCATIVRQVGGDAIFAGQIPEQL